MAYIGNSVVGVEHPSTSALNATTGAFTGAVTANAGVVVDNITIDGTEIDLSSGSLTVDVAGDLILDADGGGFLYKDGGTEIGRLFNSSSDFIIKSIVSDKDLKIQGNDGGSAINAVVFDMSAAGAAAFNAGATFAGASTITTSDNSNNLTLTSTDADANTGPNLVMHRDSGSPADNDAIGELTFNFDNDAAEHTVGTRWRNFIIDASDGTEDAAFDIFSIKAGSLTSIINYDASTLSFNDGSADIDFRVESNGDANMLFVDGGNDRVGIGTGSPVNILDVIGNGSGAAVKGRIRNEGGASGDDATLELSIATASEEMRILFTDSGGTAGQIVVDGGDNSMAFETGTSEGMRVTNGGAVLVGLTIPLFSQTIGLHTSSSSSGSTAHFNRTGDGGVVRFGSDATEEGNISISGTTVSYNGGHLARWSQATDGNRINGLVKGTVMTNLDQMAVWSHDAIEAVDAVMDADGNVVTEAVEAKDAYTEENEQLNCMAVSSVEGDTNVAGVFVNWDDDEVFTADMNVAMTGDMVIRIANGTTVTRGDLLMSAGDGTAKPQGDDIVRSKTIAKVTSTIISHTYDDGTFLVPCVLMAC